MEYTAYHATWCPFCLAFMEFYREVIPRGKDVILDDENNPLWLDKRIEFVPIVIATDNGREVGRLQAAPGKGITREMLEDWLERF